MHNFDIQNLLGINKMFMSKYFINFLMDFNIMNQIEQDLIGYGIIIVYYTGF